MKKLEKTGHKQPGNQPVKGIFILKIGFKGPGKLIAFDRPPRNFHDGKVMIIIQSFQGIAGVLLQLKTTEVLMYGNSAKEIRDFVLGKSGFLDRKGLVYMVH